MHTDLKNEVTMNNKEQAICNIVKGYKGVTYAIVYINKHTKKAVIFACNINTKQKRLACKKILDTYKDIEIVDFSSTKKNWIVTRETLKIYSYEKIFNY